MTMTKVLRLAAILLFAHQLCAAQQPAKRTQSDPGKITFNDFAQIMAKQQNEIKKLEAGVNLHRTTIKIRTDVSAKIISMGLTATSYRQWERTPSNHSGK